MIFNRWFRIYCNTSPWIKFCMSSIFRNHSRAWRRTWYTRQKWHEDPIYINNSTADSDFIHLRAHPTSSWMFAHQNLTVEVFCTDILWGSNRMENHAKYIRTQRHLGTTVKAIAAPLLCRQDMWSCITFRPSAELLAAMDQGTLAHIYIF